MMRPTAVSSEVTGYFCASLRHPAVKYHPLFRYSEYRFAIL
jgi:hypothetical protein